jgi:ATP-dependent helicase Lhr and Lhr-like helicase
MTAFSQNQLGQFLSELETLETRLLYWGVVDGSFTRGEIIEAGARTLSGSDLEPEELLEEMISQRLLFEVVDGTRYRTRMAETMRLMVRLRQLFPGRPWQAAATLVADYRFSMRSRRYPDRNRNPEWVLQQLQSASGLDAIRRLALEKMLKGDAEPLMLADFQVDATRQILSDLGGRASRGIIVSTGTGTGKTLAFYLPALTFLAGALRKNSYSTKTLALYPRKELLKDQITETLRQVRVLHRGIERSLPRKILVGAYYGETPLFASAVSLRDYAKWPERPGGFVCPYLRCPEEQCGGELLWSREDVERGKERLQCITTPDHIVDESEVVLTRKRLTRFPADVLFTTSEMLNQEMSNSETRHVFGLGAADPPRLMLLDEVHTYEGTHGAQVALLIRRWRHALGRGAPVQFVGLSATLRNAADFFSALVGLKPGQVTEVSPGDNMVEKSMEYQVALRGDPVSGASLLATTIQAAMLLRRMLNVRKAADSSELYGSTVYAFTDNLDVTNRLYNNLQDAEALDFLGARIRGRQPLAALRASALPNNLGRMSEGQSWRSAEQIGHNLSDSLRITRTSSQDSGVDRSSDVVVATASLEVGYNDPAVGAVLQHKAPVESAAFLQRRGRAGRTRQMRPWTVVILSDYGRDRLAYQGYDLLFDPELPPRYLPVHNRYVLRMQALFTFMEWLEQRVVRASLPKGSVYRDWSGPSDKSNPRERQAWMVEFLREFLKSNAQESVRLEFDYYLSQALHITPEEVQALLWEPPRSLMRSALPTLLRRLESNWKRWQFRETDPQWDFFQKNNPLPDFLPPSLFSDLNLPEVILHFLVPREKEERMGVAQAMKELAVGNVTRRFSPERSDVSHWIAPPQIRDGHQEMPIRSLCTDFEPIGVFQIVVDGEARDINCYRPWSISPSQCPQRIKPTSKGMLDWRSQIFPEGPSQTFETPANSPWAEIVQSLEFFTHNGNGHVVVRRFALGSQAELLLRQQGVTEISSYIQFVDDDPVGATSANNLEPSSGTQAAVGFTQDVDGICVRAIAPTNAHVDPAVEGNTEKIRCLRTAYFVHRVINDTALRQSANSFLLDWLAQIYLSTLTWHAMESQSDLVEAHNNLQPNVLGPQMAEVLDVIFQTLDVEEAPEDAESAERSDNGEVNPVHARVRQKVHRRLLDLCTRTSVTERLWELASVLWSAPTPDWYTWVESRFHATLGAAILEGCQRMCPQFDADSLVLDIDPGPPPPNDSVGRFGMRTDGYEIWVTENSPGGAGVIEEILGRIAEDPMHFFRLVESALAPSDFELVDREISRLLNSLDNDEQLREGFNDFRDAVGNNQTHAALATLRALLRRRGYRISHSVMTAINSRLLRPGSDTDTDRILRDLINDWKGAEERLGVEIDARVFAYVAARQPRFEDALSHIHADFRSDPQWNFQAIYGLLWPRGNVVRKLSLSARNPYASIPSADRQLLRDCLEDTTSTVSVTDPNWRDRLATLLEERGVARLGAPVGLRDKLKMALLSIVSEPLDVGFLSVYPLVERIESQSDLLEALLVCHEAIQ